VAIKGPWQAANRLDRLIVLVLCLMASGGLWWSLSQDSGSKLVVEQDGRVQYVAPLTQEARIEIKGPLGPTVIEVRAGRARVVAASCPQRLCMGMGSIHRKDQVVACLPNRVLLRISGAAQEKSYDLLSQ